jgi:hypothetical protein
MTPRALPLVVLLGVVVVGGCGVPSDSHPTVLDDHGVQVAAPPTTRASGVGTRRVQLCLVSGGRLTAITVALPSPLSVARTLHALIDAPGTELPPGVRSAVTDPALMTAGTTTRGVAHVDLGAGFALIAPSEQILAVGQVVCTLTSLPGVGQVQFTQGGRPTPVPRADGAPTEQPVSRFDYLQLLPGS